MQSETVILREAAVAVVRKLQQAHFIAYWAGGCVRDQLLGIDPIDYDIATNATPDEVVKMFPRSTVVGKNFGVVVAPFQGVNFEIATFREDRDYVDGRRPTSVVFVTPEEDAKRRDFTINAMFFDPVKETLHDFVGGQVDLAAKKIRCVGDADRRFAEDHLRMLRAVRFASRFGFEITDDTAAAIQKHAASIALISKERIQVELTRTFLEAKKPGKALQLMESLGLLKIIMPEVAVMREQEQPPQFHPEGDVLTHTIMMLDEMAYRDTTLTYATLFHDLGKPVTATHDGTRIRFNCHAERGAEMAYEIMRKFHFPTRIIEDVTRCVRGHMRFMDAQKMRKSTLRRLVGGSTFETELELHRLDCGASHGMLDNYEFLKEKQIEMANEPILPPHWISGRDIMAIGVKEGPEIGKWIRAAYDAQLNGEHPDRETMLAWLKTEISKK